jgi:hypothetical protein
LLFGALVDAGECRRQACFRAAAENARLQSRLPLDGNNDGVLLRISTVMIALFAGGFCETADVQEEAKSLDPRSGSKLLGQVAALSNGHRRENSAGNIKEECGIDKNGGK